jgi:hypothetical protein
MNIYFTHFIKSQKNPTRKKESLSLKKPRKLPFLKMQKSRVFQFHFSNYYLNKRIWGRFKQTAGRKSILKLNW